MKLPRTNRGIVELLQLKCKSTVFHKLYTYLGSRSALGNGGLKLNILPSLRWRGIFLTSPGAVSLLLT